MPILLLAKLKLGALLTFAYFGIALLAKKAIVASLISLAISIFIGLRSFMSRGSSHDAATFSGWSAGAPLSSAGWAAPTIVSNPGWSSAGAAAAGGWDADAHGAFSAQNQAYSAYNNNHH